MQSEQAQTEQEPLVDACISVSTPIPANASPLAPAVPNTIEPTPPSAQVHKQVLSHTNKPAVDTIVAGPFDACSAVLANEIPASIAAPRVNGYHGEPSYRHVTSQNGIPTLTVGRTPGAPTTTTSALNTMTPSPAQLPAALTMMAPSHATGAPHMTTSVPQPGAPPMTTSVVSTKVLAEGATLVDTDMVTSTASPDLPLAGMIRPVDYTAPAIPPHTTPHTRASPNAQHATLAATSSSKSSSSKCKAVRRLWTKDLTMMLLQEVQANDAHIPSHGETVLGFSTVASQLNASGRLPWKTDGKHCHDRLRLTLDRWRADERAKSVASGGGEEFGEYEQLCQDIATGIEDRKAEKAAAKAEVKAKEEGLLKAGQEIRQMSMARRSGRDSSSADVIELDDESAKTTPSKKRKLNSTQAQQGLSDAIHVLEESELERMKFASRQDERDEKRLLLEQTKMDSDCALAKDRNEIERRRVAVEERRVDEDANRAAEAAEERRLNMEVQKTMLEVIKNLRQN